MAVTAVVSGQWSVVSGKPHHLKKTAGVRSFHWSLVTGHWSLLLRGQSAVEYAVLVAIVVAALIGMSVYTKRALSGKWRAVGDTFGSGRQFEPGVTVEQ